MSCVVALFFASPHIFGNGSLLAGWLRAWIARTKKSVSRECARIPVENFKISGLLQKKSPFQHFLVHPQKISGLVYILMPPTFRIASLKHYTPKLLRETQTLTLCQPLGVNHPPKWEYLISFPPSWVTLGFSNKMNFPAGGLLPAYGSAVYLGYLEPVLVNPNFLFFIESDLYIHVYIFIYCIQGTWSVH